MTDEADEARGEALRLSRQAEDDERAIEAQRQLDEDAEFAALCELAGNEVDRDLAAYRADPVGWMAMMKRKWPRL